MRKESPLMIVWDKGKIVDLIIHCPTASHPQPDETERELVRIFKEHRQLKRMVESYGNNPAGFDWAVLGKVDDLEVENEQLKQADKDHLSARQGLEQRFEKLEVILEKYGRHLHSCELVRMPKSYVTGTYWSCTCGFSSAMECNFCGRTGYLVGKGGIFKDGSFYTGHCTRCGKV